VQDENDVVEAVCLYLAQQGFVINERRHTTQRGIDIKATHPHSGKTLYVEAKGGTSSRCGSARYGEPYTKSQIFDRTAKGVYTLLQIHGKSTSTSSDFALAVPDTKWFREYLNPIKNTVQKLRLQVLLVDEDKNVRIL
jgi:Holliday junction resolvase-like predicted endonuclease